MCFFSGFRRAIFSPDCSGSNRARRRMGRYERWGNELLGRWMTLRVSGKSRIRCEEAHLIALTLGTKSFHLSRNVVD